MQKRIEIFNTQSKIFDEIPNVCCLDTKRICKKIKIGEKEKVNLYNFINIIEKLRSGSFNSVYVINHIDDEKSRFVLRIPKMDSHRHIYIDKTDDDYDNEKMAIACVSSRYALLLSNLVKKNIFPNFVQIVDVYFCNGKYPVTIQEYCDYDLCEFFKIESMELKIYENLIVQSLLTYYFMHNYLQISNFDAKCTNILVKQLDSEITLRYNFDGHIITIKTDKIALITDFDFTRGNHMNNNMLYILESYIKELSTKHTYYNSIHEVLNKLQPDVHLIDVVQFMITLLVFNSNKYIKNIIMNFLYDYVVRNIKFFECIKKYYSNVLCETNDSDVEYNVGIHNYNELMQIDTVKYRKLMNRIMTYTEFHSNFGDQYIKQLYKIDRFYCELEEYMISHLESSTDENYICNIYAKTITRFIPALSCLFDSVIKFKISHKLSIYETLLTMSMIFYFIENNIDFNKEEYMNLGLVCIYLTNHRKYSLDFLKTHFDNSNSKKYLYNLLKKILKTLSN